MATTTVIFVLIILYFNFGERQTESTDNYWQATDVFLKELCDFEMDPLNHMMNLAREINNFTDSIIKIARTRRSYPISLPEINEVFRHRNLSMNFKGRINMTKGFMHNYLQVKRYGSSKISIEQKGLDAKIIFFFEALVFKYKYSSEYLNFTPSGFIYGKIQNVTVETAIQLNINQSEFNLELVQVTEPGVITVAFAGNKAINWFMDVLRKVSKRLIHKDILNTLTESLMDKVKFLLKNLEVQIRFFKQHKYKKTK